MTDTVKNAATADAVKRDTLKNTVLFAVVFGLIIGSGFFTGWKNVLFTINMGLISAIMALGVNLQWGFAGLFNVGVMGFVALGGLAAVLIGMPATPGAFAAGGTGVLVALVLGAGTMVAAVLTYRRMAPGRNRSLALMAILIVGFFVFRGFLDPNVALIEDVNPAATGYLGGLNPGSEENYRDNGLIMLLAWPVGGVLAAGAAWLIGKAALGLRSDYLAIATLGIAEIIIAVLKNEDWLTRGVKNVVGIPAPSPMSWICRTRRSLWSVRPRWVLIPSRGRPCGSRCFMRRCLRSCWGLFSG